MRLQRCSFCRKHFDCRDKIKVSNGALRKLACFGNEELINTIEICQTCDVYSDCENAIMSDNEASKKKAPIKHSRKFCFGIDKHFDNLTRCKMCDQYDDCEDATDNIYESDSD